MDWFIIPDGTNAFTQPAASSSNPAENGMRILLDENGNLRWPNHYENPPKPPAWLTSFSDPQRTAWMKFMRSAGFSDFAQTKISFDEFFQIDPPTDARANAQFILLRAQLVTAVPGDAMDQLLTFAEQHSKERSEAGLPLSSLALASAMDFAKDETDAERIINSLAKQISDHPSVITLQLVGKAKRLFSTNNLSGEATERFNELLGRFKRAWENYEQLRDMAESFLQSRGTNKFWIQSQQVKFFCLLQPKEPVFLRDGKIIQAKFKGTSVRFIPQDEIRRAFETGCD